MDLWIYRVYLKSITLYELKYNFICRLLLHELGYIFEFGGIGLESRPLTAVFAIYGDQAEAVPLK